MKVEIDYSTIIRRFHQKNILVIGDLILDIYIRGASSRLSPEAPVPVVDVESVSFLPGGAANTALNIRKLGAAVSLLSVSGLDQDGEHTRRILSDAGVDTTPVFAFENRKTISKSRVMSGNHVITRFDSGTTSLLDKGMEEVVTTFLENCFTRYDAIVFSDYNKGTITDAVLQTVIRLRQIYGTYVAVDSKRLPYFRQVQPALVKPNYNEFVSLVNGESKTSGRAEQVLTDGAATLPAITGARTVAVTLDAEGAVIISSGATFTVCSEYIASPNVVGAGDTFTGAFALAEISGAEADTAGTIACAASSIAVRKTDTACCTQHELEGHFSRNRKTLRSADELEKLVALYRAEGKRVVFTNGCFDILHSGHVSYLNRARQLGDILIVGVNNDQSIRRLKGEKRPINPLPDRLHVLAGLAAVNHVVSFGEEKDDTPVQLIRVVKPDVFVKGGDYTRDKLPEAETVESLGGEIVFLSLVPDHSTTSIIQQIHKTSTLAVA